MFALGWWYYGPGPLLASRLVFGVALIVLFAIDLEHHLLPNAITLPGIAVGLLFSFFAEPGWLSSSIGIALGAGVLYLIAEVYYRVRHEEGLGMGDVKMLAMVGAFLGIRGALLTIVLGAVAGSIVGVVFIKATGKDPANYPLPFGSFLGAAALVAAIEGQSMMAWYMRSLP